MGVEDGNLVVLRSDLLGDDQLGEGADVARLRVNRAAQFTGWADRLLGGRQQGLFHGLHKDVLVDAFLAFPVFQYC